MATARQREQRKRAVVSAQRMAETSMGKASKAYKMPPGAKPFIIDKAETYEISIVAYEAGPGNPSADEGELAVGRSYWAHRGIGPNNETYCCPAKTFSKPCAVCDYRGEINNRSPRNDKEAKEQDELVKSLLPKQRQLFNVINHKAKEDEVLVFDYSYHLFGKHLFSKSERRTEYRTFADPEEGHILTVGAVKETMGKNSFYNCTDIEFAKRKPLSDDVQKAAHNLDKMLVCPGYDELKAALHGGTEEDEPEEKPAKETRGRDREEEEPRSRREPERNGTSKNGHKEEREETQIIFEVDQQVKHIDHGICTIIHVSGDGTSLKLEDKEGNVHRGIDPEDCTLLDDEEPKDEPEEKPAKGGKAKSEDPDIGVGDTVKHRKHGECTVVRLKADGIIVETEDGDLEGPISEDELTLVKKGKDLSKEEDKPKSRSRRDLDFDDDKADADEREDKPTRGKARR